MKIPAIFFFVWLSITGICLAASHRREVPMWQEEDHAIYCRLHIIQGNLAVVNNMLYEIQINAGNPEMVCDLALEAQEHTYAIEQTLGITYPPPAN